MGDERWEVSGGHHKDRPCSGWAPHAGVFSLPSIWLIGCVAGIRQHDISISASKVGIMAGLRGVGNDKS